MKPQTKFTFETCLEKGLLERILPSQTKALHSLTYAETLLSEAREALAHNLLHSAIDMSYQAAFHAARSLLHADGWREKSHACVARYLEEKYANPGQLNRSVVDMLDSMRNVRHNNQYNVEFVASKVDAQDMVKSASEIIVAIKSVVKKK